VVVVLDGPQRDGSGGRGRPLLAVDAASVLLVLLGASEFFAARLATLFLDVLEEVGQVLAGRLEVALDALVGALAHLVVVREGVAEVVEFVVLVACDAHAEREFLHDGEEPAMKSSLAAPAGARSAT